MSDLRIVKSNVICSLPYLAETFGRVGYSLFLILSIFCLPGHHTYFVFLLLYSLHCFLLPPPSLQVKVLQISTHESLVPNSPSCSLLCPLLFLYLHVPPWWCYVISWLYISIGAGDSQIHVSNPDYSLDMQAPTSNWQINIFSLRSNRNMTLNIAK